MKLFKNIMSRKPDPAGEMAAHDPEIGEEPSRKATADDSGARNSSLEGDLYPGVPAADPAPEADDWAADAFAEDDEEWKDEDWGEDWEDDDDGIDSTREKLVEGIRGAIDEAAERRDGDGIRNWSEDDEFGRRRMARRSLTLGVEDSEDRILEKTNSEMTSVMSSRRRSAMAHLKKAAAATKADRVLSNVVGRDPATDFDEQSPYRDDLAKVVKPRATSRPVSRPVSRTPKVQTTWEVAPADDDAGLLAAASEAEEARTPIDRSAFEKERQQHVPADLTEDEFISDEDFVTPPTEAKNDETAPFDEGQDDEDGDDRPTGPAAWVAPIFENDAEDDETGAVDLAVRRASRVRSKLAEEFEAENAAASDADGERSESGVNDDFEQPAWGLGGARDPERKDESDDAEEDWTAPSLDAPDPQMKEPVRSGAIDLGAVREGMSEMMDGKTQAAPAADESALSATGETLSPNAEMITAPQPDAVVEVPTPAIGRAGRSAGRVKTRLLGFQATETEADVFDRAGSGKGAAPSQFPVGWMVIVEGPGHGHAFTLQGGVMQIGRGEDQGVRLDFGDTAISRENHAAVAYDDETGKFFLGHGGKSNLVRLNGHPVLSTEELSDRDRIRLGETTLMFVALCNEDFIWNADKDADV